MARLKQEELIVICQYHKSLAHKSWKLFWQEIHTVRRKLKPSIQNILKKHAPTIRKAKAKFRCILLRSLIRCVVLLQVIDDVKQCLARYSLARGYSLQPSLGIYIYARINQQWNTINSGIRICLFPGMNAEVSLDITGCDHSEVTWTLVHMTSHMYNDKKCAQNADAYGTIG